MRNNSLYSNYYNSNNLKCSSLQRYNSDLSFFLNNGYVISDIEVDQNLPMTPIHTGFVDESTIPTALSNLFAFLSVMQLYPVVYLGENEGRLVRHVVPKSGLENEISSYGSEKDFFPHVDNPDLKIRCEENSYFQSPCPDTLTLLCLRQVKGVATSLIFLKDVVSDLDEEDLELLQQNRYQVKRPASFSTNDTTLSNIPILVKDKKGDYLSRFDYHNVYSDSFSHNKALEKFKSISLQPEKWKTFYLKPGQAITFDNQKLLHTRNSFSPTLDGNDRWLLRVFGLFQKPNPKFLVSENCNHHLTVN